MTCEEVAKLFRIEVDRKVAEADAAIIRIYGAWGAL